MDVFRARRDAGKTVVLVTHDMATVQSFCDRAMLIHDGETRSTSATPRRRRCATSGSTSAAASGRSEHGAVPDVNARLIDAWLENRHGERVENIEQGEPIGFNVIFEARHDLASPVFGFHFLDGRRA